MTSSTLLHSFGIIERFNDHTVFGLGFFNTAQLLHPFLVFCITVYIRDLKLKLRVCQEMRVFN